MDITETLYVADREEWRQWLEENYKIADEIWLVYYRKHTGTPRISYNYAVEEALCFGWIDSITKGIDEDRYAQRFTPRKPRSGYSQTNKERLRRLLPQEKIMPALVPEIQQILAIPFEPPADILQRLKAEPDAWKNFQRYSAAYQRIRLAYIDHARGRPAEFEKRLQHFLKKTAQDKQFGYGIEEYY